ncbi:hypothetical protein FACS1894219_07620 [Clostridia bacterium]|nr:hypothetical protein FACS1894219_07620 [Clostridia bacterium]
MAMTGRLPGAVILHGAKGEAKSEQAACFAKALLCSDGEYVRSNGEGCGICPSCLKADDGNHPDLAVITSDDGALGIDAIRDITAYQPVYTDDSYEPHPERYLYFAPNESDRRVYIIENAEEMSGSAFNALLKSLEEPPDYAVFIMTTSNLAELPDTVRSRAVILRIAEPPPSIDLSRYSDVISSLLASKSGNLVSLLNIAAEKDSKESLAEFYTAFEKAARDKLMTQINSNVTPESKLIAAIKSASALRDELYLNANQKLNAASFYAELS